MCKLLVGVNNKPGNPEFEKYIEAHQLEMYSEKNGCAALVVGFDNKIKVFRSLHDYDEVYRNVFEHIANSKLVSIHTRTATSGGVNEKNVHFFGSEGYYFAHNGFVRKYHSGVSLGFGRTLWKSDEPSTFLDTDGSDCRGCWSSKAGVCKKHKREGFAESKKDSDEACDSLQFLINMPKPVTPVKINKEIADKDFTGLGFLIGEKKQDAYLLIKKDTRVQTDKETFAIYTSFTPNHKVEILE